MGTPVFVMGEMGSGKTASLRNFKRKEITVVGGQIKPWSFPNNNDLKNPPVARTMRELMSLLIAIADADKELIVIDDFQYIQLNDLESKDRADKKKMFQYYDEIAFDTWDLMKLCQNLKLKREKDSPQDSLRIYFLTHSYVNEESRITRVKTLGRFVEEKISIEGTSCYNFWAKKVDNKHIFITKTLGSDTAKSPMGIFEDGVIENDLKIIDKEICKFHKIKPTNYEEIINE